MILFEGVGCHVALTASQMVIVKRRSVSWKFSTVSSRAQFVLLISGFWESLVNVRIRRVVPTAKSTIFLPGCGTSTAG